jgi:His-Xaa-Ser system protein HxsD
MIIQLDRKIYSDACISKCIYGFSGECEIRRTLSDATETVELIPSLPIAEVDLKRRFFQRLNDYKLREIVIEETKDIRTILYAKAFADCEDFSLEEE